MSQPPAHDSGRHRGHGESARRGERPKRLRRTVSALQVRRAGVASAVVSTLGIAMVNTTGIAHSEPPVTPQLRTAGTVLGAESTGTDPATDGLTDPALATGQADLDAAMQKRALADQVDRHAAMARFSLTVIQQRSVTERASREQQEALEALRWVRPMEARVTQRFGGANGHPGIDLGAPMGTPIVAAHAGTVIYAGWESGYGYFVQVLHENNIVTCYAHLSRIDVRVGQKVSTGKRVGLEGSTGRSTGPHLHFEVRLGGQNGAKVDPLAWLAQHGVSY